MFVRLERIGKKVIGKLKGNGSHPSVPTTIVTTPKFDPILQFHSDRYLRHNARRLEHLASLRIPVRGKTVLEVGAGIGDHSHYYIDRGCKITITEAREENLTHLRTRYSDQDIRSLDLEHPSFVEGAPFDLVHCYGILYHVKTPGEVLRFLSEHCREMLFLETCVSFGKAKEINLVEEDVNQYVTAVSGVGCRPTRIWLYETLRELFDYVYLPKSQPNHEEFPLDWDHPEKHTGVFSRAIFICSRTPLINEMLTETLLDVQVPHE